MPALRNTNYTLTGSGLGITNTGGAAQTAAVNNGAASSTGYLTDRFPSTVAITAVSLPTASTYQYTTSSAHGFSANDVVSINGSFTASGGNAPDLAGTRVIASVPSSTTFVVNASASAASGTLAVTGGGTVGQASGGNISAASANSAGTLVSFTTGTTAHTLVTGQYVTISGITTATSYNIANAQVTVTSPTTFTIAYTTPVTGTPTLSASVITVNNYVTTADIPVSFLSSGSANQVSVVAPAAVGNYRIDLIALDLYPNTNGVLSSNIPALVAIKGTEVSTGTAQVPNYDTARYVPLATVPVSAPVSTSTIVTGTPTDVRNTLEYLPVRAYNRSQAIRIGKVKVGPISDSFILIEDPASRKEFTYHSAIGAVYVTGAPTLSNSDQVIHTGGSATFSTTTLTMQSGEIYNRVTNTYIPLNLSTNSINAAVATAGASNSRYDLYFVDKFSGVVDKVSGNVVTTANISHAIAPQCPPDKLPICLLTVTATNIVAIRDLRPRQ